MAAYRHFRGRPPARAAAFCTPGLRTTACLPSLDLASDLSFALQLPAVINQALGRRL
jgi:hypothetical protein